MENTELENKIIDALPHGSGINGDWYIEKNNNSFEAHNFFEAMNENGFYCHVWDFTVEFRIIDNKIIIDDVYTDMPTDDYECCGFGLQEYLDDVFFQDEFTL